MSLFPGFFNSLGQLLNGEINCSPEEIARRARVRDGAKEALDRRRAEDRKKKEGTR